MIKFKSKNVIEVGDWDRLVEETYGKPYNFQQQDDCKPRGTYDLTVPSEWEDDYENDTVSEIVNGPEMGVSFKAWLARDPKKIEPFDSDFENDLFWTRNFYPNVEVVANDLHTKGLLPAGEYVINIDW